MKKVRALAQAVFFLMLGAHSGGAQTGADNERRLGSGFDEWTVDCSQPGKGLPEECYASLHYYPGQDDADGSASPVRAVFMFSVGASGVKFHEIKATNDQCAKKPVRKIVDGQPIHALPLERQIEAVLKGRVYMFEYVELPCSLVMKFTTVSGASVAYDRMMSRWKSREFSIGREVVNRRP